MESPISMTSFNPRSVILAPQVRTILHAEMIAGIQQFELTDWMPAHSCGHDGARMDSR